MLCFIEKNNLIFDKNILENPNIRMLFFLIKIIDMRSHFWGKIFHHIEILCNHKPIKRECSLK